MNTECKLGNGPGIKRYTIPKRFFDDHVDRGLIRPTVIERTTTTTYTVRLTYAAWKELLSDARHYSDHTMFDRDLFGLCRSAKATATRLSADPHHQEESTK